MSPQPSPVRRFLLEDLGETGSLIFGEASPSPLTIPKALIAKIWGQVDEGIRIVPRGGVEVGGLLVGPRSKASGVLVDGIIPLSIEYEHGPVFRMSASDLAKIAVSVESVQVDPSKAIVGFYRSQTRGKETFRDSDREIFDAIEQTHTSFATDFLCYLVLAPVSKIEMSAYISMWNGEDWYGKQFRLLSNPFSVQATSFAAPLGRLPDEKQVTHPVEASLISVTRKILPQLTTEFRLALPELKPLFHAVLSAVKAAGRSSKQLYVLAGLLALAGAIGGIFWIVRNHAQPAQTSIVPLGIGFSASRQGPVWKLSWDRAAMALMKPGGAVLAIKDGNHKKQLNLTPADLSSGIIFYTPRGGDLVFSLQLERDGAAPIEEHIRVLDGQSGKKPAEHSPQPLPNTPAFQAKASSSGSTALTKTPDSTSSAMDKELPVDRILDPNLAQVKTAAVPAITRDLPPSPVETPQSPTGDAHSTTSSTPSSLVGPTVPSAEVPPTAKPNYIGPKPVQQAPPERPPNVNSKGVRIQVHVEIDVHGNVTKATAIGVTAANSALVSVTEHAARSWQFEPAKMDGRSVPSEMDFMFRF